MDIYSSWGDNERAIEYLMACVQESQTSKEPHDYPASVFQFAEFLAKIGDYDQAIIQAEIALHSFEQLGDQPCVFKARKQIEEWSEKRAA